MSDFQTSGFMVLVKAEGCMQGPKGGWHYETGSGHKVYVSGPEECNKMAQKFLDPEQREQQEQEGQLPEERTRRAGEAIEQHSEQTPSEFEQKAAELTNAVAADGKGLAKNMWNSIRVALTGVMASASETASVESVAASVALSAARKKKEKKETDAETPDEMKTAITAADISSHPSFDGTPEEAERIAKVHNMQQYMEHAEKPWHEKLPTALNDEKRGHTAMLRLVFDNVEGLVAKAARKAGEAASKVNPGLGSQLKMYAELSEHKRSQGQISSAEKSLGASYVTSYVYSMLAKPIYYGTYIKAGAAALGKLGAMGATAAMGSGVAGSVASTGSSGLGALVGTAASLVVSMQVWKHVIKPMSQKMTDKVVGTDTDPLITDVINGYVRLNELTPEAREQIGAHMTIKSLAGVDDKTAWEMLRLCKALEPGASDAPQTGREIPYEAHHVEAYKKVMDEVLPGVLVDVMDNLEANGFSEKEQAAMQKLTKLMIQKKKNPSPEAPPQGVMG